MIFWRGDSAKRSPNDHLMALCAIESIAILPPIEKNGYDWWATGALIAPR